MTFRHLAVSDNAVFVEPGHTDAIPRMVPSLADRLVQGEAVFRIFGAEGVDENAAGRLLSGCREGAGIVRWLGLPVPAFAEVAGDDVWLAAG